jgi:C1A family cysteine protease
MSCTIPINRFGWIPDKPDHRDYSLARPEVRNILKKLPSKASKATLPSSVDLRPNCSPIVDQGQLGSCTANAASGLYEYMENRAFGTFLPVSRLFIYKATRDLMKLSGDTGAEIRSTLGALALFGAPPEDYYPYEINVFDDEPSAFMYAFAASYKALTYVRLDPQGSGPNDVLTALKSMLANKIPVELGFTVYDSFMSVGSDGLIPFPQQNENVQGGHAVDFVGFDDSIKCPNSGPGAFILRNSWGLSWADKGYAYMPYDFVLKGLAQDFWSILSEGWIDTKQF